jgi:hypothetical protein
MPAWACTLLLLLAGGSQTAAQQETPFQGRNKPPEGGVDVFVSPIVDHLVDVVSGAVGTDAWQVVVSSCNGRSLWHSNFCAVLAG